MKNVCACIGLVSALLMVSLPATAQKVGTTSLQFLRVMPCARATAMGDAYSATATGAEAVFWNPGGVGLVTRPEFSSTYIDWIFDTQLGALSFAMPAGDWGAFALQLQYVDYGVFDESIATGGSEPGLTGRQFHPFGYLVGVSYAKGLTERFSTGVTVKLAHESLYDKSSVSVAAAQGGMENVNTFTTGLLFDFGLRYSTGFRTVTIAASIQNFGPSLRYAKEANPAPLLFRLGISADLIGGNSLFLADPDNRLSGEFDLFQPNDYTQQMHAGVEYEYAGTFALRAGYKFNYDEEGFTFGGGIRKELSGTSLSVDYSYGSLGVYLGRSHRISLGVGL